MSSDGILINNSSSPNNKVDEVYSSYERNSPSSDCSCSPNKKHFDAQTSVSSSTSNNRKDSTLKLPYPVLSDHRDPSFVQNVLQKETQATSKKILDVNKQIEECEKRLTTNLLSENVRKTLKLERVKRKQQLDALKKHERRVNLQIDYITTKTEIKGLEDERKQIDNETNSDKNQQIEILLRKLKQKLDQMKIYMKTRNEQMKKISNGKQKPSNINENRKHLTTSQKSQQNHHNSTDLNRKRPSSTAISHSSKRLKSGNNHQTKPPVIRLTSRLTSHQSQSNSIQTPTVRFLNKSTNSTMTTLNSTSPTTPASSSSTLSPPLIASTSNGDTNNVENSLKNISIPSIDEDDELDLELNIDELFNDDPYSHETV